MTTTAQHPTTETKATTCEPWCSYGDCKEEESCLGVERSVELSRYPQVHVYGPGLGRGGGWVPDDVRVYLMRQVGADSHVQLDHGDNYTLSFTPAEARRVAAALVAVADEMEAGK